MNQRARWLLGLTVLVLVVILANEVADAKSMYNNISLNDLHANPICMRHLHLVKHV